MRSYSAATGKHYVDFDALVAAEANGYVVVGITESHNTAPWCVGPFKDKVEARKVQARMRAKIKRLDRDLGVSRKSRVHVRVLWKELS